MPQPKGTVRRKDITGVKVGKLTVLYETDRCPKGRDQWVCRCDCGTELIKSGTQLRQKRAVKSCGCAYIKLDPEKRGINRLIRDYQRERANRHYEWSLTFEEAEFLFKGNCFYCGAPPSQVCKTYKEARNRIFLLFNGIDRVDNTKGYLSENVVSCCCTCNKGKQDLTVPQFLEWIIAVGTNV
jgi:hypothetical protein